MLGIGLIFAGFIVLGIFGARYFDATVEAEEFVNCFEYFDDKAPVQVDCDLKLQNKTMFFSLVVGLVSGGIVSLVKGVKGKWDQDVKPEDMLGSGGPRGSGSSDSNTSSSDKTDG